MMGARGGGAKQQNNNVLSDIVTITTLSRPSVLAGAFIPPEGPEKSVLPSMASFGGDTGTLISNIAKRLSKRRPSQSTSALRLGDGKQILAFRDPCLSQVGAPPEPRNGAPTAKDIAAPTFFRQTHAPTSSEPMELVMVVIPPGPVGMFLGTHEDGFHTAVMSVRTTSPVYGSVLEGDIMHNLDGQDISKLFHTEITELIKSKMQQQRSLVVARPTRASVDTEDSYEPPQKPTIAPGARVEIHGLHIVRFLELNGKRGVAERWDAAIQRWEVRLDGDPVDGCCKQRLCEINLAVMACIASAESPGSRAAPSALSVRTIVVAARRPAFPPFTHAPVAPPPAFLLRTLSPHHQPPACPLGRHVMSREINESTCSHCLSPRSLVPNARTHAGRRAERPPHGTRRRARRLRRGACACRAPPPRERDRASSGVGGVRGGGRKGCAGGGFGGSHFLSVHEQGQSQSCPRQQATARALESGAAAAAPAAGAVRSRRAANACSGEARNEEGTHERPHHPELRTLLWRNTATAM